MGLERCVIPLYDYEKFNDKDMHSNLEITETHQHTCNIFIGRKGQWL
jgi:hypothetical protein